MDPSRFLASPDLLHPLIHALSLTLTRGLWLVLAAIACRLLFPLYLKGGR